MSSLWGGAVSARREEKGAAGDVLTCGGDVGRREECGNCPLCKSCLVQQTVTRRDETSNGVGFSLVATKKGGYVASGKTD